MHIPKQKHLHMYFDVLEPILQYMPINWLDKNVYNWQLW